MSMLMFFDHKIYQRIAGVDNVLTEINKQNYESSSIATRTYSFTTLVNQTINNINGNYIITCNCTDETAQITLYVDAKSITFNQFFSAIISGTNFSITSSETVDIDITMIKLDA